MKGLKLNSLVILISMLTSLYGKAEPFTATSSTQVKQIQIGETIELTLKSNCNPNEYLVRFPELSDTFNGFEIIERRKIDSVFKRDMHEYAQKIILTHFDSGVWVIPGLKFEFISKQGKDPQQIFTDSIAIKVNTIDADTAKPFKPIMDIRGAKESWQETLIKIGGIVLVALVLILGLWFFIKTWREKNKKPEVKISEPYIPPHEKALQRLEKLKVEALYAKGEEKFYHTQLTDIVKGYLEDQFGIDCFEKTTSELMQGIRKHKALANSRQSIRNILELADMVKFAKSKPTEEEHVQSLEWAILVVKESYKKFQSFTINTEDKA